MFVDSFLKNQSKHSSFFLLAVNHQLPTQVTDSVAHFPSFYAAFSKELFGEGSILRLLGVKLLRSVSLIESLPEFLCETIEQIFPKSSKAFDKSEFWCAYIVIGVGRARGANREKK